MTLNKSKYDKELEKAYKELKEMNSEKKKEKNDLRNFFIGLIMLCAGLFMIFNEAVVSTGFGSGYFRMWGGWSLPNGIILLPFLAGIVMLFLMKRKIFGWIVLALGVVFILLSILMSTTIRFPHTSLYEFIIMFGLTAAGGALVARELLRSRG